MTDTIQFKRRINGAVGSPGAGGAKEGEIAFNAPGVAGSNTKPDMFFFDGTAWRTVNPSVTVATQSIQLPAGADIGAAYTAWLGSPAGSGGLTGNVVIATFGTPPGAFILTNPANPGAAASWTSLGSATSFATLAQVIAGSDTLGAINSATLRSATLQAPTGGGANPVAGDAGRLVGIGPLGTIDDRFLPKLTSADTSVLQAGVAINALLTAAGLRAATVTSSAGAADHDKIPRLGATGKLDPSVLPATSTFLAGAIDPTAAAPVPAPSAGAMYFAQTTGALGAGFTGLTAGTSVKTGDSLMYDGANWHLIPNEIDLAAYLPLAGTNLMTGNIVWSGTAGNKAGTTIFDGKGGTIDNVLLDCGTY